MLSILGFIAVIIAAYYIYKTAKDTNRSAVGWALITLAVGFGVQIVIPVLIGIVISIIMLTSGNSEAQIQEFIQPVGLYLGIGCLILSFVGIWMIIRYVSGLPEQAFSEPPPVPPNFEEK